MLLKLLCWCKYTYININTLRILLNTHDVTNPYTEKMISMKYPKIYLDIDLNIILFGPSK